MAKKCASCGEIPSWSFSENIVAYCPIVQKYVTVSDGCDAVTSVPKAPKAAAKKAPAKKAATKKAAAK